jgi:hypothetical protein
MIITRSVLTLRDTVAPAPLAAAPILQGDVDHGVFFFVWSPTEQRPKKRHTTLENAQAEAQRLHDLAPEKRSLLYRAELQT